MPVRPHAWPIGIFLERMAIVHEGGMKFSMHFSRIPLKSPDCHISPSQRWARRIILTMAMVALLSISFRPSALAPQDDTALKRDDAANAKTRIGEGEKVYQQRCIACHNKAAGDTSPFGAPNLHGIFKGPSAITSAEAREIIIKGKNTMPGWGTVLTPGEISSVIAYLRTQ
jgi:mono/diheme cytochrome c family protein